MGESSDPIASSRGIWILSRAAVTRSITQTKHAGKLAAPWGRRSHSLSPLGIKDLIGAGNRNRVNSVTFFFFSFFIFDCGSNATGFFRDTYMEASPRARRRLDEAGGNVRVQYGVCLLREGRVQSVRA